jgi:murein DD-endopeptidase MepM/ murein hydrolase activator NlpD
MSRRFWVSITLGLTAYLALPLPGLSAPLSQRIQTKRSQVERSRHREGVLTTTIAGYSVRIRGLQGRIHGLQARQRRAEVQLAGKRAQLQVVRNKLERARDLLVRLRASLEKAQTALADRLVDLYKADEPDVLTVILQSDGFADLLERTDFLERVSDQDRRIVARVRTLKAATEAQAKRLGVLERQRKAAADAIQARRDEIAASKGNLLDTRGDLAGARDGKKAILARVRSSRAHAQEDLQALEAQQARVAGALQNAQGNAPAGPIRHGSGQLIWPVNGPIVGVFGEQRPGHTHTGIDIAVPTGTPIRAADGGRVVMTTVMGGYGNFTCIQHTSSMSTCYAHQSRFATSSGASVRQGQVIGYVGTTGNSTGPHLHFEVRINGSPVNPMGYL